MHTEVDTASGRSTGYYVKWSIQVVFIAFIGAATIWALYLNFFAPPPEPVKTTQLPPGTFVTNDIDMTPKSDEQKAAYTVAPERPKNLRIPKLTLYANIIPVGLKSDNSIDAPKTAVDTGWYTGSGLPGQAGAMLIDGHVQGQGGPAVFTNLKRLEAGDTMTVERGDGTVLTYRVVRREHVAAENVDMGQLLRSVNANTEGLNLITCGGTYDRANDTFSERVIIFAERVS